MIASIVFIFVPVLLLFGYQGFLEMKGINDPLLSISLFKTTILLDASTKLLLLCFAIDLDTYALISLFVTLGFFMYFFVSLSLNIPKVSLRNNRKYPQETNYTVCAFKVVAWSCCSILLNLFLLSMWIFEDPTYIISGCVIMIVLIALYIVIAAQSLIRLDRLKYPSIRSLNGLSQNNSPIVLLRSFKIDSNPTLNGKVFDETICENLDLDRNPIISLANPDEILPSGGSLKIQAKDSEWKEVVKEVLGSCRAVILVEGLSEGLHWEISKLKEYVNPSQLFVMVPARKYRELAWCYNDEAGTGLFSMMRNLYRFLTVLTFNKKDNKKILDSVWKDFSTKLNEFGIHTQEAFPGDNVILNFDENWNSRKLDMKKANDTRVQLGYIIDQTSSFNQSKFDYSALGKKIESYEVNGFLKKEDVAPFKRLVDRANRIGRIAALVCFVMFVICLLIL